MGFSNRKVTISTCGLAAAIERMADDPDMDASLAVSLHATTDELRDRIMPVNRTYPLARLMKALHYYCTTTANTVTIEYALFKGVNDSDEDAERLMELLSGLPCMINVLAFNPFPGAGFERPDEKRVYRVPEHPAPARLRGRGQEQPGQRHQRRLRAAPARRSREKYHFACCLSTPLPLSPSEILRRQVRPLTSISSV